jgi:hypothetical protein
MKLQSLVFFLGRVLFFLMLIVPTAYQEIKGVLLLVCCSSIILSSLRTGKLFLSHSVVNWLILVLSLGVCFVGIGVVRGNPGAVRVSTVHILWPMVYAVLVSGIRSRDYLLKVIRTMIDSSLLVSIYSIIFVMRDIGLWPSSLFIDIFASQNTGIYSGYIEINLPSVGSLIFLLPFLLCLLLTLPKNNGIVTRNFLFISTLLCGTASLLSGRRALWLSVALSILFFFVIYVFLTVNKRNLLGSRTLLKRIISIFIVLIVTVLFLFNLFKLNIYSLSQYFFSVIYLLDNSGLARYVQFNSLISGWVESPIFGSGLGAAASVIRSTDQKWAYELSYVALLFHTGIIGTVGYFASVIWIYWKSLKIIVLSTDKYVSVCLVSILVGITSFFIANGTNPYLSKYDFLWVIFLPIAFINLDLLKVRVLYNEKTG